MVVGVPSIGSHVIGQLEFDQDVCRAPDSEQPTAAETVLVSQQRRQ